MRRYFYPEKGFVETDTLHEGCWMKVVSPTTEDLDFLTNDLGIPESFIADIADADVSHEELDMLYAAMPERHALVIYLVGGSRLSHDLYHHPESYYLLPRAAHYDNGVLPSHAVDARFYWAQPAQKDCGNERDGFHFPPRTQLGRMVPKVPQAD